MKTGFFTFGSRFTLSITVRPSIFGIMISSSTTSGSFVRIMSIRSSPFPAFPTTFRSRSLLTIVSRSWSVRSLSSAIATFIVPIPYTPLCLTFRFRFEPVPEITAYFFHFAPELPKFSPKNYLYYSISGYLCKDILSFYFDNMHRFI